MRSGGRESWAGLCACFTGWLSAKCLCLAVPPSDKELLVTEVPPNPARNCLWVSVVYPHKNTGQCFSDGLLLETGWGCKSCSAASEATGCVLGYLEMAGMEFLAHCSAVGWGDGLFFFPKLFATPFLRLLVLLKQWTQRLCSAYLSQRKWSTPFSISECPAVTSEVFVAEVLF